VEHRLLLDALKRREGTDAELVARLHISRTRRALLENANVFATAASS
jgi:DNA-binding GntR family transcriptional regulator